MKKEHSIRVETKKLHPWLQYKLKLFLKRCKKQGLYLIVTEGFRSKEYQDELYAKGRTKPGNIVTNAKGSDYSSQHQWGIAFDIAINGTSKELYSSKLLKKAAKIAKKIGLAWGGDWVSPVDMPHFYLDKWGDTPYRLKLKYGTFEKFKKTWTKKVYGTKKGLRVWNKTKTKSYAKLKNGTKVQVMYKKGKYYVVWYAGKKGYMKAKYLK